MPNQCVFINGIPKTFGQPRYSIPARMAAVNAVVAFYLNLVFISDLLI